MTKPASSTREIASMQSLEILRSCVGANYTPSPESLSALQGSNLVLISGQFAGAGKSTFIQALEAAGRINIPSWTNRELRAGEVEGVDKIRSSLSAMAQKAVEGYFIEIEEVRNGIFYATPAEFTGGTEYVKDLELKGALRLRFFAPELPVIIPLPPLNYVYPERVTEWERRVIVREGLYKSISDKAVADLEGRLAGVVEESARILDMELYNDPNILVVINDSLTDALRTVHAFLATGEKAQQTDINEHVQKLQRLASVALDAAQSSTTLHRVD